MARGSTPPTRASRDAAVILVDTADAGAIDRALAFPAVYGFTTNPALIARAAGVTSLSLTDYVEAGETLCRLAKARAGARHVMIQTAGEPGRALDQAQAWRDALAPATHARLWIKLPPTPGHLALCGELARLGCASLVTAVFTAAQAEVAMGAGADGVAVYFGRLTRGQPDGEAVVARIAHCVRRAGKMLLLASLAEPALVERALAFSADLTLPPDMLDALLTAPGTTQALAQFEAAVRSS